MNDVVEMVRNTAVPKGRDRFSCSLGVWTFLQDLGQAFGWQPSGTTYIAPANRKAAVTARHNYQPGDALDYKRVDSEDAMAWARALEAARQSLLLDSMIAARWPEPEALPGAEATVSSMISEFTEYAFGGEFAFASEAHAASEHDAAPQRSSKQHAH